VRLKKITTAVNAILKNSIDGPSFSFSVNDINGVFVGVMSILYLDSRLSWLVVIALY